MQQTQTFDQLKDLHGELTAADLVALKLILSAHICKSATDQLIKAPLKFLCLILQDRNEDGSPAEQRPEPRQDGCTLPAIDPAEPFTGEHLFWAWKNNTEHSVLTK